ncbi:MAG: hypothetical protein Q9221_004779 [Calogaya cf. arnoldii]
MSEPHIKQDPERKGSMAQIDKPKPHVRACESCRTRKIRCLPQDSSKDGKCQRCAKSGRECIYSSPEKRNRRKRTDARVADLEHMVQMLAARLEHEQRARHDQGHHQQPHEDNPVLLESASQNPNILSPPPSPNEYPQSESPLNHTDARPRFQSPTMATKPNQARKHSTPKPITNINQPVQQSPLPAMASLSPCSILQSPLPSPLPQTRIPNILNQQYTAWPSFHPSLDPESHQHTSTTQDVYSPCPSTLSYSDTCSSEISQNTILDTDNNNNNNNNMMFDLPSTSTSADYNAMDAAISAQLNMPCQDHGIWWPQSNIMGTDYQNDTAAAATMGNWMPGEDVFSWQTMQWG